MDKDYIENLSQEEKLDLALKLLQGIQLSNVREEDEKKVTAEEALAAFYEDSKDKYSKAEVFNNNVKKYDYDLKISKGLSKIKNIQAESLNLEVISPSLNDEFKKAVTDVIMAISGKKSALLDASREYEKIIEGSKKLIDKGIELDYHTQQLVNDAELFLSRANKGIKEADELMVQIQNIELKKKENVEDNENKNTNDNNNDNNNNDDNKPVVDKEEVKDIIMNSDAKGYFSQIVGKTKEEICAEIDASENAAELVAGYIKTAKAFMNDNENYDAEEIKNAQDLKSTLELLNSKELTAKDFKTENKEKFAKKVVGIKQASSNLLNKMKEKKNVCIAAGIAIAVAVGAIINPALLPYAVAYGAMGYAANEVRKGFKK